MKKSTATLTQEARKELETIARKGSHRSQKVLDALILLACNQSEFQQRRSKNEEIAAVLNVSMKKIHRIKKRLIEEGLQIALKCKSVVF